MAGLVLAGAIVTSVSACGGSDEGGASAGAEGSATTVVRATVAPGIGSLPYRIATERGLFKKRGIEVETTLGYSPSTYISALDRQFDVSMMVTPDIVQAASAGRKIKVFAGMSSAAPGIVTSPVVTKDPKIRTVEDLIGKKLAVLELGGTTQAMFKHVLEPKGLDSAKIDYVVVPFENQADQLNAGRVDAIFGAVGFYESLLADGAHIAARMPDDALAVAKAKFPVAFSTFISSSEYAAKNPEILREFRAALAEAAEWIDANRDEAIAAFGQWVGRDPDTLGGIEIPDAYWKMTIDSNDFAPWLPILEDYGLLKGPVNPQDLVAEGL